MRHAEQVTFGGSALDRAGEVRDNPAVIRFARNAADTRAIVFWRGKRDGWKGHVGFYAGEDADAFHVLGGNQGNAVSIVRIGRDRLLGARWPSTAPVLVTEKIELAAGDTFFSTNEA